MRKFSDFQIFRFSGFQIFPRFVDRQSSEGNITTNDREACTAKEQATQETVRSCVGKQPRTPRKYLQYCTHFCVAMCLSLTDSSLAQFSLPLCTHVTSHESPPSPSPLSPNALTCTGAKGERSRAASLRVVVLGRPKLRTIG